MKKVKKIVLYSVISLIIVGGILGSKSKVFSNEAKKNNSKITAVNSKVSVQVQQAKTIEKDSGASYKATLEAYEEGTVSSKVSGKVAQILFENGKSVSQGDPLIVLDDTDIRNQLRSAESQLKVSQSQLNSSELALQKFNTSVENAQRNYDRTKSLFEQGAVAKVEFENAETALKNAKTDYDSGKASIEMSKASIESAQVSIDNLQTSLNDIVIKAPISGIMDGKTVKLGQMASQGTVLAKVNNTSSIYAVIQVEQENIKNIQIGQKALVKVNGGDDKAYEGIINRIDASADPNARVFSCKILLDNKDNSLHPGVFAKAQILSSEKVQVLVVPIEALGGNEGQYYVFVSDNGVAKKHKVTIGETDKNMVEIKSGIKSEDKVICTNTSTLQDGDKIQVVSK
ncbi:efflux RND transporter periplasmic adaptor subunit [Clostridiaceae bacterium UIB06]|nr:efflux RND transporter periplasmic adaptor subunit [Clostridiaceae bacterium UIB06]